ncbi:zinc finger protein 181-like [Planococcus citri]|uniref:zinc finger protein 181-like n=1 Tax=Planococcus citri TaxID=170843 RepID=UPI0031F75F4E
MAQVNADFDPYDDVIQSCDTLLSSNSTKFHLYAKHQEELRLQFTATNENYKILKTWLHVAYEDILASTSEHGDLVQIYQTLLSSNFFEEFLEYANSRETLQFKFIKKLNECKDLMKKLNETNKSIVSLKTKHNDLTRRYGVTLENRSVNESTEQRRSLRSKFIETLDECECFRTCLDSAYEEVLTLKLDFDVVTERYRILSKNKSFEEFLDCAKKLEVTSKECKCSNSSADRAIHSNTVVEVDLSSNAEMDTLEAEVDVKEFDVDLSIKREHQQSYSSENNEDRTVIESSIPNGFDITEVNLDDQIKLELQQPSHLNENSEDLAIVKQENPDDHSFYFSIPVVDEFCASSNTHFETDDPFEEKIVVIELLPEAVEDRDVFIQPQVSTNSSLLERALNGSQQCQGKLNSSTSGSLSIKSLFHRRFECVICGKSFPKKCTLNEHMRIHDDKLFHCEKCDKSFKTKNNKRKTLKCSFCGYAPNQNSNKRNDKIKFVHELFAPRCDICGRIFSTDRRLKEHISDVHDEQKSFKCATSDRLFARESALKSHKRRQKSVVHAKNLRFRCAYCDKGFRCKDSLVPHMQKFHKHVYLFR